MGHFKFSVLGLSILLFSCSDRKTFNYLPENDTVKVLNTAIAMGMTGEYMPGASPLTRKYHFGDSILLTSVSLPVDLLPRKVKNQCFKILPSKAICSMLVRDSSSAELPNYLSVRRFEQSDTGFYVQMQSLSCLPFGGGGSLGIYLKKVRDSFVVVSQSSSSIN